MKALTISQPYASLIAYGEKWVENRSWPTKYRGPMVIHAGKGTQYLTRDEMLQQGYPIGSVVAVADIQACVRVDWTDTQIQEALPDWCTVWEFLDHKHTEGPWCWILGNIRRMTAPIDTRGSQGLWNWVPPDGWTIKELVSVKPNTAVHED